jgi:hypothetical protein
MNDQQRRDMARKILNVLYRTWASHGHQSLNALIDAEQWEKRVFDDVIQNLERDHGLVKLYGVPNVFDLTPEGVLYAEENGIATEDEVNQHRAARAHVLSYLANLYDTEGSRAHAIYHEIAKGAPVRHELDILVDIDLLRELDYVEAVSSNSYRITRDGLRFHRGEDFSDIV